MQPKTYWSYCHSLNVKYEKFEVFCLLFGGAYNPNDWHPFTSCNFSTFASLGIRIVVCGIWWVRCQNKYPPSVFHTFIHQSQKRKPRPKRSQPSKWFIKVNNGMTSSNQLMPRSLSSPQPWFPHLGVEKEKKNESFDTFYRKRGPVLQKSSSFFKHILFGWGGVMHTLTPVSAQGSCQGFC